MNFISRTSFFFRTLVLSFVLILFFSMSQLAAQSNNQPDCFQHIVKKGEGLYSISRMYKVTEEAIIALNPGSRERIVEGKPLCIPQPIERKNVKQELFHTIQAGETLYSISVKYGISAKLICEANQGLSAENFKANQVIRIPGATNGSANSTVSENKIECETMRTVRPKENIFRICAEYELTQEELIRANPQLVDGLKVDMLLCIPKKNQGQADSFVSSKKKESTYSTLKVAVALPFMLNDTKKIESIRSVEYYEGLLLALDSIKKEGISVDLHSYDIGNSNESLQLVLAKPELSSMDLIFSEANEIQINTLSKFTESNGIHLVFPFPNKTNVVFDNPTIYQVSTPTSYLYSKVYEHFVRNFRNSTVVFLQTGEESKVQKTEFVTGLKRALKEGGIYFTDAAAGFTQKSLSALMSSERNTIFIPTSSTNVSLRKILPILTATLNANPTKELTLFGYPEWQQYTNENMADFYKLNTYFYASFFTNSLSKESKNFIQKYRRSYNKEMLDGYPKYGILGFDTSYFFIKGLSTYGSGFDANIGKIKTTPIQTALYFERVNNWGGFVNKKVFFINFAQDLTINRIDFE